MSKKKVVVKGGGNNLYGEEMAEWLSRAGAAEREAYILMERLTPHASLNYLVLPGQPAPTEVCRLSGTAG